MKYFQPWSFLEKKQAHISIHHFFLKAWNSSTAMTILWDNVCSRFYMNDNFWNYATWWPWQKHFKFNAFKTKLRSSRSPWSPSCPKICSSSCVPCLRIHYHPPSRALNIEFIFPPLTSHSVQLSCFFDSLDLSSPLYFLQYLLDPSGHHLPQTHESLLTVLRTSVLAPFPIYSPVTV